MKEDLGKMEIAPDLVDLQALVDPTLSYGENLRNVEKTIGITTGKKLKGRYSKRKKKELFEQQNENVGHH